MRSSPCVHYWVIHVLCLLFWIKIFFLLLMCLTTVSIMDALVSLTHPALPWTIDMPSLSGCGLMPLSEEHPCIMDKIVGPDAVRFRGVPLYILRTSISIVLKLGTDVALPFAEFIRVSFPLTCRFGSRR